MAKTATIALAQSTSQVNQRVGAVVTISNGDASDVQVLSVNPLMKDSDGGNDNFSCNGALGVVPVGPGQNVTVPASGELKLSFGVIGQAPSEGGSDTYDVTCDIRLSDGTVIRPTPATLTVEQVPQFIAQ